MVEVAEILPARIAERLEKTGKSRREVSLAIGAHAGYVRDLLDPERFNVPSATRIEALARELETTTEFLLGTVAAADRPRSEVAFADVRLPWRGESAGPRVPVLGTGYCADLTVEADGHTVRIEQLLFEPDHVIQLIERPPALGPAKDAYAIYYQGDSMEPRFFQGELGIVDPRKVPGPGDFVIVQLNDGASDAVTTVLVKRLVRPTTAYIELEQYNPPLRFRIPRERVVRMHKIATTAELQGA